MKKISISIICLVIVMTMSSCGGGVPSKQLTDGESISSDGDSLNQMADRAVLIKIYEELNGIEWLEHASENWCSDKPIGEWQGVKINDAGRVIELTIDGRDVSGMIPAEIGELTELEALNLTLENSYYDIDNVIPAEIVKLTKLKTLSLTDIREMCPDVYNKMVVPDLTPLVNLKELAIQGFSGAIPENIALLSKLESLILDGFEGKIPDGICELTELKELHLSSDKLPESAVPEFIGRLSKLERLVICYEPVVKKGKNQPNAKFPESVWDLTNLESLILRSVSNTGGPIPGDKVSKMVNLDWVEITNCGISGAIPAEFFASGKMSWFDFSQNKLTGSIPSEIGNCLEMSDLVLSKNQLTGNIPQELAKCKELSRFLLANNQITGTIPEGLAKFYRIQRLDLSNNQLVGTIPEGFGDCENLMNFDLSNNKLTGNVPEGLDGCEYLWGLNLSGNQLSHNIPAALKKHPNFSDFKF